MSADSGAHDALGWLEHAAHARRLHQSGKGGSSGSGSRDASGTAVPSDNSSSRRGSNREVCCAIALQSGANSLFQEYPAHECEALPMTYPGEVYNARIFSWPQWLEEEGCTMPPGDLRRSSTPACCFIERPSQPDFVVERTAGQCRNGEGMPGGTPGVPLDWWNMPFCEPGRVTAQHRGGLGSTPDGHQLLRDAPSGAAAFKIAVQLAALRDAHVRVTFHAALWQFARIHVPESLHIYVLELPFVTNA